MLRHSFDEAFFFALLTTGRKKGGSANLTSASARLMQVEVGCLLHSAEALHASEISDCQSLDRMEGQDKGGCHNLS